MLPMEIGNSTNKLFPKRSSSLKKTKIINEKGSSLINYFLKGLNEESWMGYRVTVDSS